MIGKGDNPPVDVHMSDNLPKTLACPSCGVPLEFDGKSAIVHCKFCKSVSLVPGFPEGQTGVPAASLEEIVRLARSGNLIEAIRQYRELYDIGLKEAKEAVEALAEGRMVEAMQVVSGALTMKQMERVLEEVQDLLRSGNKIEAIRRYREAADVSLAKAKDVIDQVEVG